MYRINTVQKYTAQQPYHPPRFESPRKYVSEQDSVLDDANQVTEDHCNGDNNDNNNQEDPGYNVKDGSAGDFSDEEVID